MSTTPKSNRTTHTPGPWRLDGRSVEGRCFDGSYHYICDRVRGQAAHNTQSKTA
jgi:hypothetical protein